MNLQSRKIDNQIWKRVWDGTAKVEDSITRYLLNNNCNVIRLEAYEELYFALWKRVRPTILSVEMFVKEYDLTVQKNSL